MWLKTSCRWVSHKQLPLEPVGRVWRVTSEPPAAPWHKQDYLHLHIIFRYLNTHYSLCNIHYVSMQQ